MFLFYLQSECRQQNGDDCQDKQQEIRVQGTLYIFFVN